MGRVKKQSPATLTLSALSQLDSSFNQLLLELEAMGANEGLLIQAHKHRQAALVLANQSIKNG
jgi:hypothetical protein